jgi:hypothetical protein
MKNTVLTTLTALAAVFLAGCAGRSGPDYLGRARSCADTLLEHGRDRYGTEHSPLIASALDRKTLSLIEFEGKPPRMEGIRNGDRALKGANPMHDQDMYQSLYALTVLTGDQHYAAEADRTLKWFFENCQSPATGLMTWGEHICWGFKTETIAYERGDNHEFAGPWVMWDKSFELAPEACVKFAEGLWLHQVDDHESGDFSRHAGWSKHVTGKHNGYPRHGGFYITAWAQAYKRTNNPMFLEAIETLVDHYNRNSSEKTGAIPCSTNPGRIHIMWPESNLSLAVDLWDAAKLAPPALALKMRQRAVKTDEVYLSLTHEFDPEGRGFVAGANVDTLERLTEGPWTDTAVWATAYGKTTDAQEAILCHLRWRQTRNERYRKLILDSAARYLDSEPEATAVLYPGPMADAINLMLVCHELTGEKRYLQRADHFGKKALEIFFDDTSSLPKAGSIYEQYETITGSDDLIAAMLNLWAARNRPGLKLPIEFNNR